MSAVSLLKTERDNFHKEILKELLVITSGSVASNADKDSPASCDIALHIANALGAKNGNRLAGQSSGNRFEKAVEKFLKATFLSLGDLRPGKWGVKHINTRNDLVIAEYEQYDHMTSVAKAAQENKDLAIFIGNDYTIASDVLIFRETEEDSFINSSQVIVDKSTATRAIIRKEVGGKSILHASISCKWTMRTDRAQNARAEALNLIRNRKGRVPHIAVVTGEPLPSRLSSLALGTGDIDCVYHFALTELIAAVDSIGQSEASDLLRIMIEGKRLKDITDLPLDLAV